MVLKDIGAKYDFAMKELKNFDNYIELADFRTFLFLILNLSSAGPEAILKNLGMGSRGRFIVPFDQEQQIYFTKLISNMSMRNQVLIYVKSKSVSDKFVNNSESPLFTKFLSDFERQNLLPKDVNVLTPKVKDLTAIMLKEEKEGHSYRVGIETLFENLAEFIITHELKYFFLLETEEADIAFIINMAVDLSNDSKESIQYFDIYVDETKSLRSKQFVRIKTENIVKSTMDPELLDDLSNIGRNELFNNQFTLIIPVKSFASLPK